MVAPETLASEKERLYESSSLRDDLNDTEATILLEWGEAQVDRLAQEYPDELEQKARFLRQLLKNINRFVGQREFNDHDGQMKYMSKFVKYLESLGWSDMSEETFFTVLPEDKANMAANLIAILRVLSPPENTVENEPDVALPEPDTPTSADLEQQSTEVSTDNELENPNEHSINQANNMYDFGDSYSYGEEE